MLGTCMQYMHACSSTRLLWKLEPTWTKMEWLVRFALTLLECWFALTLLECWGPARWDIWLQVLRAK
jgi:hypothetical protein